MFRHISYATEPLHFTQIDRAKVFYKFVCSVDKRPGVGRGSDVDKRDVLELVSFYLRYHYLLSRKDTTASNALIGAWQKKLGHEILWEDFNLGFQQGPPSARASPPTRTSTRKSTGCIPASKPVKGPNPLTRRRSEGCSYISDSSLTPLSSSDDEVSFIVNTERSRIQSPPSTRSVVVDSTTEFRMEDLHGSSFGVNQGITDNCSPRETHMVSGDEPPPTPPQDAGVLIDPLQHFEPESSSASLSDVIHGSVDPPMNCTSISAACLPFERGPIQSSTVCNHSKSLSAPAPTSSSPPCRKRKKSNCNTKKRHSKQKKTAPVAEDTGEPMVIDTPIAVDSEAGPGPASTEPVHQGAVLSEPFTHRIEQSEPPLKISIYPSATASTHPTSPGARVPLLTSCTNVTPRSAPSPIPGSSPGDLKGLGGTNVVAVPGLSRPALHSNPPIWAQVRAACQ